MKLVDCSKDVWHYNVDDFALVSASHTGKHAGVAASFAASLDALGPHGARESQFAWLDLGAGPGGQVSNLLKVIWGYLGTRTLHGTLVDIDPGTCERLRGEVSNIDCRGESELFVIQADAIDFMARTLAGTGRYRVVSAIHLFYYLDDWSSALESMRLLSERGFVFVALKSGQTPAYELMRDFYDRYELALPKPFFGEDFLSMLQMKDISHRLIKRVSEIALPKDNADLCRLMSFIWRLTPELMRHHGKEVCQAVRETARNRGRILEFRDMHFVVPGATVRGGGGPSEL